MKRRKHILWAAVFWGITVAQLVFAQGKPSANDTFRNVKMLVETGGKSEPTRVTLDLRSDGLVVETKKGYETLKSFPYAEIKAADYSFSKSPRWRAGIVTAAAFGVFALPVLFLKGKKHWLTVRTDTDSAVFRLDKSNYQGVLRALEVRSGQKVERLGNQKHAKQAHP
jgi:hypothetical protein